MRVLAIGAVALAALTHAASAQVAVPVPDKASLCAACHGQNGNSTDPTYPILAGQSARYMYLELQDYAAGRRSGTPMQAIAKTLSSDDMLALANWFSTQKWVSPTFEADPAKVAAGKAQAAQSLCSMCHLGGLLGQNEIPRLAGQHYEYVKRQLADFKSRRRTNDGGSMTSVASTLTDAGIDDLAQYIATLR